MWPRPTATATYAGRRGRAVLDCVPMAVTLYGVGALSFMMLMYALERRGRRFVAGFALGCLLSSAYGFWSGAWPFGVVELVWSAIAWRRFGAEAGTT
jgi:hypothetical protein